MLEQTVLKQVIKAKREGGGGEREKEKEQKPKNGNSTNEAEAARKTDKSVIMLHALINTVYRAWLPIATAFG